MTAPSATSQEMQARTLTSTGPWRTSRNMPTQKPAKRMVDKIRAHARPPLVLPRHPQPEHAIGRPAKNRRDHQPVMGLDNSRGADV